MSYADGDQGLLGFKEYYMNRKDLKFLQSQQVYPSVSIFVRTHRAMPEREKDPIMVKNLVAEAKERLLKEFTERDIKKLLDNLDMLVKSIDYTRSADGLAIFVNEHIKQMFTLPLPLKGRVLIDSTFETRDILGELGRLPRYWVLSLSEKPTRLYHGLGNELTEIIEPENDTLGQSRDGFPLDYIKPDIGEFEFHQGGGPQGSMVGRNSHLDSKYVDDRKKTFFKKVDHLLSRFITADPRPLVVAGTEKNIALFEMGATSKIAAKVSGDFTEQPVKTLEKAVSAAMQDYLAQQQVAKIKAFEEAINTGHHAFGLESVWRMAQDGRIRELLVEEGYSVRGRVNPENPENLIIYGKAESPEVSDDLINLMIDMVMDKGGGQVTICKPGALKDYQQIAAILRY